MDARTGAADPAWSPSGRSIAYVRDGSVWVAGSDGSRRRRLTRRDTTTSSPDWSPDGRRIVFARGGDIRVVAVADARETRLTSTPHDESSRAWSPRGDLIAFAREDEAGVAGNPRLYVMSARGTNVTPLLADDAGTDPVWSPDGRTIVFARGPFERRDLYLVGVDGLGLRPPVTSGSDEGEPDWGYVAPPEPPEPPPAEFCPTSTSARRAA